MIVRAARPLILVSRERPAEERRHAEDREQIFRHARPEEAFGLALSRQVEVRDRPQHGDVFERPVASSQVPDVRKPRAEARHSARRRRRPQIDKAIGQTERQRLQQHAVDDAEHRRRRADAERDGHDRDGGEAGRARHQPHAIAEVLPRGGEPGDASRVARFVHQQGGRSEFALRGRAGGVRRQAARNVLVDEVLKMRGHFVRELAINRRAAEERTRPLRQDREDSHIHSLG